MNLAKMALAACLFAPSLPAAAETFDLQSVNALNSPIIGQSPVNWADMVRTMTNGEVDVKVHGAGELVPPLEVLNMVSSGAIPMGYDWIGYWSDAMPTALLLASMPFGPTPEQAMGWMYAGGGMEILQKAYDPFNVKVIPCHIGLSEAAGWYNREINTIEDFQGLKIRIAGLGAQVISRLGASPQLLPAGEIYLSLETGRLDAAEFSMPLVDEGFGFQDVADYYYFPGWHQPSSWSSILISMPVWDGFTSDQQTSMVDACRANVMQSFGEQLGAQVDALARIEEAGAEIRNFSPEILDRLREESIIVLEETAAGNELLSEAYASLKAYVEATNGYTSLQSLGQ
ncbi:TRAP transporter substrate-binding protein [Sinisalibacter aestuarii]|uniref:C4-dicarboxylate ABC transporter n=1 Tax=Sinisalibacter aestuarii TaxID=2949426 RepID=A0ABQ5LRY9_9RHOB|nr:TRAP transporter substrate-binding protein [Sinisalibacter aestuarii]GKY87751.1 C4-dicarboxylate ABC transporter [Sinisalibacter aestuarii]